MTKIFSPSVDSQLKRATDAGASAAIDEIMALAKKSGLSVENPRSPSTEITINVNGISLPLGGAIRSGVVEGITAYALADTPSLRFWPRFGNKLIETFNWEAAATLIVGIVMVGAMIWASA